MNKRGQVYAEFLLGLFLLFAVGVLFVIFQQIWENNLKPQALANNANAGNLALLDTLWEMYPIPVLIAIVLGIALAGRIGRVNLANVPFQ